MPAGTHPPEHPGEPLSRSFWLHRGGLSPPRPDQAGETSPRLVENDRTPRSDGPLASLVDVVGTPTVVET